MSQKELLIKINREDTCILKTLAFRFQKRAVGLALGNACAAPRNIFGRAPTSSSIKNQSDAQRRDAMMSLSRVFSLAGNYTRRGGVSWMKICEFHATGNSSIFYDFHFFFLQIKLVKKNDNKKELKFSNFLILCKINMNWPDNYALYFEFALKN